MGVELALELGSDVGRQVGEGCRVKWNKVRAGYHKGQVGQRKQGDQHVTAEEQAWEDNISKLCEGWVIES